MGMPDYKEPEVNADEPKEILPLENKLANNGKTWEKVKRKPATRCLEVEKDKYMPFKDSYSEK